MWDDRVRGHAVFPNLRQLEEFLATAEGLQPPVEESAEWLSRIRSAHTLTKWTLETADARIIPLDNLDNLSTSVSQLSTAVSNFCNSRNTSGHLTASGPVLDGLLRHLALIPQSASHGAGGDMAEQARQSYSQFLGEMNALAASVKHELGGLKELTLTIRGEVAEARTSSSTMVNELQAQFQRSEEARGTNFLEQLRQQQERHNEALEAQRQAFEELRTHERTVLDATTDAHSDAAEKARTALAASAAELLKKMEEHHKTAQKLLAAVNRDVLTTDFGQAAGAARSSKEGWHRAASAAFLLPAVWAIVIVCVPALHPGDAWGFVARSVVTIPLFVFAVFASKQAAIAQREELRNHQRALELAALPPFVATLPREKRQEIQAAMADRLFGKKVAVAGDGKVDDAQTAIASLLVQPEVLPKTLEMLIEATKAAAAKTKTGGS